MQSMQRRFGRMTTTKSADNSQVAVLLKDFEDADNLFTKIIESTKAWRDAWVSIATFQSRMADEFDGLYAPIVGSSETETRHIPEETPPALLSRTNNLRREYDDLRGELVQELNVVEQRMSQPAEQAKSYLAPMKKAIKKRNDKKSDYERFQSKVDGLIHKPKRSDRENVNLAKAELDLSMAKEVYQQADQDLLQRLPTLISLLFSLAPYILRAQVEIQNRMLAHYYTVLSGYCEDEQLPNPPPSMDQVVQDWENAHRTAQADVESLSCLSHGKALRLSQAHEAQNKRPSIGGRSISTISSASSIRSGNSVPRYGVPFPMLAPKPCAADMRSPSPSSSMMTPPISVGSSSSTPPLPSGGDYYMPPPPVAPTPSPFIQPAAPPTGVSFSPAGPKIDHFQLHRQGSSNTTSSAGTEPFAMAALKKKKPPPPPRPTNFVTALYDYDGQGAGDLVFREGDRIRVIQKTNSTDDWWEGELRGVQGAFPANYVE
ncbi:uncharacterized protein N7473_003951 [Penicillium subrubescens]|uniref:Regulator of cytoskeleton and endocytosis n=1 Tax=Penicillium subrubescens TaxID=1316194 RepID=A0A1Q5UBI0_9EURO|nr:uncharacterized protein N7473_003951 [Penicillium subrubescens]KAJ5907035.1 hypothetical protein N7473_003951 [Penicillium subrubescens]OKP09810.1 Regulator of cytoskeleton and endocytosis [Penicillium subrubescens]